MAEIPNVVQTLGNKVWTIDLDKFCVNERTDGEQYNWVLNHPNLPEVVKGRINDLLRDRFTPFSTIPEQVGFARDDDDDEGEEEGPKSLEDMIPRQEVFDAVIHLAAARLSKENCTSSINTILGEAAMAIRRNPLLMNLLNDYE